MDNEGEICSEHGILLTQGCYLCDPDDFIQIDGHWIQKELFYLFTNSVKNGEINGK